MGTLYLLAYLLYVLVGHIFLAIIPTALNFLISGFVTKGVFQGRASKLARRITFIVISFLIGLNTRLPEIYSDHFIIKKSGSLEYSKKQTLTIPYGSTINLLSNTEYINFKLSPLATVSPSNEGQGLPELKLSQPKYSVENVNREISLANLGIDHSRKSPITLSIEKNGGKYISKYVLTLFKNDEIAAKEIRSYRNSYRGDFKNKYLEYLAHGNIWMKILDTEKNKPILGDFLNNTVITEDKLNSTASSHEINVNATSLTIDDLGNGLHLARGKSGDKIGCVDMDILSRGGNLLLVKGDIEKPIAKYDHRVEKYICNTDEILFIRTPSMNFDMTDGQIKRINYITGDQLIINYTLPSRSWSGFHRKALIYFEEKNGYILGVEEFGKDIPTSIFYFYIAEMPNKSSNPTP